jgi:hypothetical protein
MVNLYESFGILFSLFTLFRVNGCVLGLNCNWPRCDLTSKVENVLLIKRNEAA